MSEYHIESCIIEQLDELRSQWLDLQKRSNCSYFQSWGWAGTWLEQIAVKFQPRIIKVWLDGSLIGIGIFVSKDIRRHYIIYSRAMFLNEYPFDGNNMVIEYNGLLVARGYESEVYKRTLNFLLQQYSFVDEFHFGAVVNEPDYQILKKITTDDLAFMVNEQSICWQVDLEKIKPGIDAYLASLSRNTRGQIRRCLRLYENQAPVILSEAKTVEEALLFFESLKDFHTEHWHLKGESGSFANFIWVNFHQKLIQKRFKFGEIQMIRITNSLGDIAFLFNYIWRRKVYVLQMGFNYPEDKRYKPGYMAHTLAIVHNKAKGMLVYDFMHGDARYKKSLGSSSLNLYWVVLHRPKLKFIFERIMVGIVRRFRESLNKAE